jgi:hypothetical protein
MPQGNNGWGLRPGESIKRTELHGRYGGRTQGGIAPSNKSPNVMIFTAPSGHKYGYFDGLQTDGCFHYTGEGQIGDQQIKQGNRALAEHAQMNKSVRLFSGASAKSPTWESFGLICRSPITEQTLPHLAKTLCERLSSFGFDRWATTSAICSR